VSEVPVKLGKYHILGLIAQGGMAEVYKAKTVGIAGFEKILALKRIRPRYAKEARFIRNFVDEARIAVSLNHRNIVQVFDFGKADDELFLAMELLEGVDLRMAVNAAKAKGERVPQALSCYILADVAAGLDYAHRKCDSEGKGLGIVHCDVSPHNVLLSNEGFVKILDFGVARARFVAAPTSRRLRGKPRYMAPEQTLGDPPTSASDVFVVGILAWELLAGRQLFDGPDIRAILRSVRESEVPDLKTLVPNLPPFLTEAVMRALDRDPDMRGSASDIGTVLARAGRELSEESSAQALSDWVRLMFPPSVPEMPAQITATDIQALPDFIAMESSLDEDTTGQNEKLAVSTTPQEDLPTEVGSGDHGTGDDGSSMDLSVPSLEALIDKRRVVVAVLLLHGGIEERRRQLSGALCDLAYKRGAVIHQFDASEVVAIFGLEVAGEDDVASAMHFAIDASDLARETGTQQGGEEPIRLRSAARAGVVAQRKVGGYQLRGDALSEARELARGAQANRPLLSGGTGRLASAQFRFRELPARRYRSRRLRVLELIGPSSHDDRARALRDRPGKFVGRENELEILWSTYQECIAAKKPSSMLVNGPPGVGKSRLVAEFVARLEESESEAILIAVAATEHAVDAPFTVAIDYMQAALKLAPGRGEMARAGLKQRLTSTLQNDSHTDDHIAESCHAVELAMELRDGALSRNQEAPAALRERCSDTMRLTHQALTAGRPSVLVLENFNKADAASIEVLRLIMEGTPCQGPTLVIMTCRDDSALTKALPSAPTIVLKDLTQDQSEVLITDRLSDSMRDGLVQEVARRAGGNPLYIEELCRNIRDVGWEDTPATVRDTVVSRIDRLSKKSRAAVQRAAVIGENFRARILDELIAEPASEHLQELVEEGLLVRSDQAEFEAEGGVYNFRHGLIQEVVYTSLSAGARRATHAKLGKLLSLRDEAGRDEPPVITARHLELGGLLQESALYWTKAGRVALAAYETASAREAFSRSLEIHNKLSTEEKEENRVHRVEALFGRARANRDLGNHDEEGKDLLDLTPLVDGDPPAKCDLLTRMASRHLRNGAIEEALKDAKRAAQTAHDAKLTLLEGEALRIIGECYERMGKYDDGLKVAAQALSIFERLNARTPETLARISMARSHLVRGRYAEALGIYQPILAEISQNRDPWVERLANNHLAVIYMCLGEFETAMRHAKKSVELCEIDGDQARAGDNLSVCGTILTEVGQYEEAQEYFSQALANLTATKSRWSLADCLIYAGTNNARLGNLDLAFEQVDGAVKEARSLKAPYIECNASIALAGLYLIRGTPADLLAAEKSAERAASLAQEATLSGAQALALCRQAEAMRRRGGHLRALVISRAAINILERHRHIEGSEEEILFVHYLLLDANKSLDAATYLERASRVIDRKLGTLTNQSWRRSYAEDVPVSAAVLESIEAFDETTR
jgi:serine/threonine protein kinase/predicted ATPase